MKAPARLALYGLGLVALFGAVFVGTAAVVPDSVVADRLSATQVSDGGHAEGMAEDMEVATDQPIRGVALAAGGLRLGEISAPVDVGVEGELSFSVFGADGNAVLDYTESHEKELHLIVVRVDGTLFRHVHPELDPVGTWSTPWSWSEPGTYRVFADFVPDGGEDPVTLTRSLEVAGDFKPAVTDAEVREVYVDGFDVSLEGDLFVGVASTLTLSVTRDGKAVTAIEPYLGAFGHLVALRDGDLAFLHVHPEGDEPEPGQTSGPDVEFATQAPTPGRYLLYFDFQVEGEVRSAAFVLQTAAGEAPAEGESH